MYCIVGPSSVDTRLETPSCSDLGRVGDDLIDRGAAELRVQPAAPDERVAAEHSGRALVVGDLRPDLVLEAGHHAAVGLDRLERSQLGGELPVRPDRGRVPQVPEDPVAEEEGAEADRKLAAVGVRVAVGVEHRLERRQRDRDQRASGQPLEHGAAVQLEGHDYSSPTPA
jgi:hypothetical protein